MCNTVKYYIDFKFNWVRRKNLNIPDRAQNQKR